MTYSSACCNFLFVRVWHDTHIVQNNISETCGLAICHFGITEKRLWFLLHSHFTDKQFPSAVDIDLQHISQICQKIMLKCFYVSFGVYYDYMYRTLPHIHSVLE